MHVQSASNDGAKLVDCSSHSSAVSFVSFVARTDPSSPHRTSRAAAVTRCASVTHGAVSMRSVALAALAATADGVRGQLTAPCDIAA